MRMEGKMANNKETYYVYRSDDGELGRVAKIVGSNAYGYDKEKNEWVSMPRLIKILFEVTNYEKISKEEAERLINA